MRTKVLATAVWTLLGVLAGAILGVAAPVATAMFIVLMEGEKANGIGTPFSLMIIFTLPTGAMIGGIVGSRRGKTGSWKQAISSPPRKRISDAPAPGHKYSSALTPVVMLIREFKGIDALMFACGPGEAAMRKNRYIDRLHRMQEQIYLNESEVIASSAVGVVVPVVLVVPFFLLGRYYLAKRLLNNHIRFVTEKWAIPTDSVSCKSKLSCGGESSRE